MINQILQHIAKLNDEYNQISIDVAVLKSLATVRQLISKI